MYNPRSVIISKTKVQEISRISKYPNINTQKDNTNTHAVVKRTKLAIKSESKRQDSLIETDQHYGNGQRLTAQSCEGPLNHSQQSMKHGDRVAKMACRVSQHEQQSAVKQ
jgi:hypothetical protein